MSPSLFLSSSPRLPLLHSSALPRTNINNAKPLFFFFSSSSFAPSPTKHSLPSLPSKPNNNFLCTVHSTPTPEPFWEDPDDGYDSSEDDEEEEEDQQEEDGGNATLAAAAEHEDDLIKEVELLLGPEEKAILQQNEAPDLSKISTMKWSPFHSLALSGQISFMDKLLKHGVDINSVDKDGLTALHKAVIGKKEPVISHLLRKGANPHVRDRDGATLLHHAVQVGAMQTVKLLIKYKVDVNVADNDGWTPLHVAMQSRSREIAKVLLINGADKTRKNMDGKTPIDLSLCYGKDFKSYELAKLVKLVPANRDL